MGFWDRLFRRKTTLANPALWLIDAFGGTKATSGISVSADSSMRCAAVYACVRVLAESVAQLPLILYRRLPNGGKERATDHPLYTLLHDAPNSWQTSLEFRELQMYNLLLRGNGYSFINRIRGVVRELLPLHPDRMTVAQRENFDLTYALSKSGGETQPLAAGDVFHLRGLSANGYTGITPIAMAREAIGLALATEQHGARLFANGAKMGGILKHPGKLKDAEMAKRIRESFDTAFSGDNAHRTALLEENMSWEKVTMTAEDSQFIETRKYQRSEIASIFRVPPHKIGDLERATFSNIEHQSLEFLTDSLLPWLRRWEQAITRDLLTPRERPEFFAEFLVDGLLRGDVKTRMDSYAVAIQNGIMSPNEARTRENLNPRAGGDEYLRPANMVPASDPPPPSPQLVEDAA